jgi:hypothetical protein
MGGIVGRCALFSNEFVFGFICLRGIWGGLWAAPVGFGGLDLGRNWIKTLRQLQKVDVGTFQQGKRPAPCSLWLRSAFMPNL